MAHVPIDIGTEIALRLGGEITRPLAEKIAAKGDANTREVIKAGKLDADVDVDVRYNGADHVVDLSVVTRDRKKPENDGRQIASFLEFGFHSSVWGTYPQGEGPWVEGRHMMRRAAMGG
ncbi:hypothetical protein [Bifidobacterium olomucense]|uniref:Uncharacterized protein n=1 Tax=Bifidobacterium olomucense TaxID=2675324 RepID=A0A7Y0EXG3_9BIFI|nr:hypothetical protein [Bifidobacterium sp. DSM 109959]NMM98154.1 hypothetical protein [Bifidobacterium sp. DSM 109959]